MNNVISATPCKKCGGCSANIADLLAIKMLDSFHDNIKRRPERVVENYDETVAAAAVGVMPWRFLLCLYLN